MADYVNYEKQQSLFRNVHLDDSKYLHKKLPVALPSSFKMQNLASTLLFLELKTYRNLDLANALSMLMLLFLGLYKFRKKNCLCVFNCPWSCFVEHIELAL